MNVSRRTALAGAAGAATIGILHYPAGAAEFTYKLGHDLPPLHPVHVRVTQAAQAIGEQSGGRLAVQVYPANQLGSDTQMFAQLRSGALELMTLGDNILGQVVPAASVPTLPLAFNDYRDAFAAMDGPLGAYVHAQTEKIGLKVFDKDWDVGFRHVLTFSRPVHNAEEMKGLKLRVPEAPVQVSFFRALGASPTPLDISELYTALQTHLVDGAELAFDTIEFQRFYEVTKFISLTAHQPTIYSMMANRAVYDRLPKNLQEILERNLNEFAIKERADSAEDEAILREKVKTQGETVITPDRESFRTVVRRAGLYAKWRDTYGAEPFALLEKAVGPLA